MSQPIRIEKVVLPKLRGFCAGVVRAVEIVEKAIEACGTPLYVRKEIVHNATVVADLRAKGAVFVDSLQEVPAGSWVVYSAHGVSPEVRREAQARGLKVLDATCPLVTKVHLEALHYAKKGYTLLLIGHADHDETLGTYGEAPAATQVIETLEDAERVAVADPAKVAVLTQTTLSVHDTREILAALRRRFPALAVPAKGDICYATTNRQDAVQAVAPDVDLFLVIGAPNSSNSLRLAEVAQRAGVRAYLIERAGDIREEWLEGVRSVGVTASASAPESLVEEVRTLFSVRYGVKVFEEVETVTEDMQFPLPSELLQLSR